MSQIAVWRGTAFGVLGYWHHGILCPDGSVIHYTTGSHIHDKVPSRGRRRSRIIRTTLPQFRKNASAVYDVVCKPDAALHTPEEVVARAESRLGEATYNLLFNNCETFAKWCVTGEGRSRQIDHHVRYVLRGFVPFGLPGAIVGIAASAVKMSVGDVRRKRMKLRNLLVGKDDDEHSDQSDPPSEQDVSIGQRNQSASGKDASRKMSANAFDNFTNTVLAGANSVATGASSAIAGVKTAFATTNSSKDLTTPSISRSTSQRRQPPLQSKIRVEA